MPKARLAIEHMTRAELWAALERRLALLHPHPMVSVPLGQKLLAHEEAIAIVRQLRLRGIQLELPLGKR